MGKYVEVNIKFDKMNESGIVKRVSERYIVESADLSHAEARMIQEVKPRMNGDFVATSAKRTMIEDIFFDSSEDSVKFYLAKVTSASDDENASTKRSVYQILVQAGDFINAKELLEQRLHSVMPDYDIVALSESPIVEVYV